MNTTQENMERVRRETHRQRYALKFDNPDEVEQLSKPHCR